MTINEMIKKMELNREAIADIQAEIAYIKKEKKARFDRVMKHSCEWAFYLSERVITNYRKAEITIWYKQSEVALKRAKKVMAE